MPSEEYVSVASGALKLKGVNSSSKIHKHKKKRPKPPTTESTNLTNEGEAKGQTEENWLDQEPGDEATHRIKESDEGVRAGKTEAELRHEERRRRRLDERLKREGTKTHKERVEELNRYLSNLSEHHDMCVSFLSRPSYVLYLPGFLLMSLNDVGQESVRDSLHIQDEFSSQHVRRKLRAECCYRRRTFSLTSGIRLSAPRDSIDLQSRKGGKAILSHCMEIIWLLRLLVAVRFLFRRCRQETINPVLSSC